MKNMLYKAMPLCMLLTLGACSSDEQLVEDQPIEIPAQGEFKTLNLSLNAVAGKVEAKGSRSIVGNWENGWASIDGTDASYSPSQVYPLDVLYAFAKVGGSEVLWSKDGDEPLMFDLSNSLNLELYYAIKGDVLYLKDKFGHIVETNVNDGFDLIFSSQKDNIFELPEHPYLSTPNGKPVMAPAGDILFRSDELSGKVENGEFALYYKGASQISSGKITEILMQRCTSSFNTKLIITNFDFKNDASIIPSDKPNRGDCKLDEIIKKFFDKYKDVDELDEIFELDFDFDGDKWCDFDIFDLLDNKSEKDYCNQFYQNRLNPLFKDAKTEGHLCINTLHKKLGCNMSEIAKLMSHEAISNFIFNGAKVKEGHCGKPSRCLPWNEFVKKTHELIQYILGKLTPEQKEQITSLEDWEISTFIAENRSHVNRFPYPNKFDMFGSDTREQLLGVPVFEKEGNLGVLALTKEPRALVDGVSFTGKPNNFPINKEYKGVGKQFNYAVSPFIFPIWNDGRYDICFSLKQQISDTECRVATLRFPIENRNYATGAMNDDIFMNQNISNFTTIIIDVNDFAKEWKENSKIVKVTPRGAAKQVVDLEDNVLEVPYQMFNN